MTERDNPSSDNSLVRRLISAAIALPLLIFSIWVGTWWLAAIAALAVLLALREFYRLAGAAGAGPYTLLGIVWGVGLIAAAAAGGTGWLWVLLSGALLTLIVGAVRRSSQTVAVDTLVTTFGALYIGGTLSAAVLIRQLDQGFQWLLLAFLITFATDTGAYAVGKIFGSRRMAPSISPGKTWEGAIGGVVAGIGVTVALVALLDLPLSTWSALWLGAAAAVVSQFGDLMESKLKRLAGAKDSGGLIPGHGGLLDRLDSLVLVFPLVYYAS
jgi:phosphatidate cytidylyltransferase